MDEAELIQAAKQGDVTAFNRLVLTYQDLGYNLAYRILGDPETAADATQDGFIAAFRGIKNFRGGSFRAWILRIVTNTCYDELRRQKRRPTQPLEPLIVSTGDSLESPDWLEDPGELPESVAERMELAEAIQECINRLDPEFRVAVVLIDVQGVNYKEAASIIGKPLGTVKSRLARARTRIKDCLRGFRELLPAQYRLEHEA
jgi:RNA polymerase sigma-70 factor (ECF subfamily)